MGFEEIKQTARVDRDHRVILSLPTFEEGTEVQVTVHRSTRKVTRRPGSAAGRLRIEPGFDDPLPEFEDYG